MAVMNMRQMLQEAKVGRGEGRVEPKRTLNIEGSTSNVEVMEVG
jgi:hypothetical protein